jgi:hypothetical protein
MAQKIDIGDYVNLNLDQNDMATALNNLNNPNGSQVIDNLMEQYDGVNMQQPQMMQQQMQPQQMQPQQMIQMQQPQMVQMQQPQMMTNLFNKQTDEKNKILKDLDLSEKKPEVETTVAESQSTKKSLMLHMKETILVVLLYIMLGNDYINTYVTKYVPYFNESPIVLFVIKVILIGLLYHIIRYFM